MGYKTKEVLIATGGGGVTSCLGMRLHHAVQYYATTGSLPDEIDSSGQFGIYQDIPGQDVSKFIFGEYVPDDSLITEWDPGHQFAFYDQLKMEALSKMALNICPMSSLVGDKSHAFEQKIDGRTCVLYRGNDKALDVPRTHYQGMVQMAIDSDSEKFLVQTDENNFYDFFKERFPDTICFEELPRIDKDPDAYVMPAERKVEFCINFLAALRAIAQAPKLILNTGNTGIWCMIFRGHTENVWQIHGGQNQKWRKLIC